MMIFDQTCALEAHRRFPPGQVYSKYQIADEKPKRVNSRNHGRTRYTCLCGTTGQDKFYPSHPYTCKQCKNRITNEWKKSKGVWS